MFVRPPVRIDKGFFISSKPHTESDVEEIKRLGIKKVIWFGAPVGPDFISDTVSAEKELLSRHGIRLEFVPYPKKFSILNYTNAFLSTLRKIRGPCLVHCVAGGSAPDVAIAYWVARGFSPSKALVKVNKKLQEAGLEPYVLLPKGKKVFPELQKKFGKQRVRRVSHKIVSPPVDRRLVSKAGRPNPKTLVRRRLL
ncbi:hypothetical protein KKE06_04900 [Candidatus Micrarchaeota archaeon]|nr:hypothetical protein [Candidatus Micrarchaeota archaeon]MBU1930546.1 hypothetical protein [Candidatus Micrarchaeota archaeon]